MDRGGRAHDLELLVLGQVVDDDVEHEAVELGLGQRIGAFQLDRVLRGEDEERLFERVGAALDGDAVLLHRLEQRGLGLGRRAVDLVGEQDVGEDRAGREDHLAAAGVGSSWMMSVPVMSEGIRSGVNWMRVNFRSSTCASVWIISVLARPGTPMMRLLPPTNSVSSTWSSTSSWPTMSFRSSATIRPAPCVHPVGERDVVGRSRSTCTLRCFHVPCRLSIA